MAYLRLRPDLLRRFRRGERDALSEVYRAYLPAVTQVLRRGFVVKATGLRLPGCASREDLADAVQEVFTRTLNDKAREAYDGQRDYAPYLVAVARNIVIDRHRRSTHEAVLLDPADLAMAEIASPELAPDSDAPWGDRRSLEIARRYVESLEEPTRSVHAARYVAALSQRDAARELGLSRPKIRKLESRMRRELQSLLTKAGLYSARLPDHEEPQGDPKRGWTTRPRTS
jgi:RNA polymerase sigma factor (sigma-70 family)